MEKTHWILLAIGLGAGVISGMFGIGGGVVIIPALALGLGYPQLYANGLSLMAFLVPVGLLSFVRYWQEGVLSPADFKLSLWLSLGLFLGGYFGATIANMVGGPIVRKLFAVLLLIIAAQMLFTNEV